MLTHNSIQLSIIIPVFNTEIYLKKAIDSALKTTLENIEIIIVNDGSSGNCQEITTKYQKKYTNIHYFEHSSNKGLFAARLTGIQKAKGEFIAHLDPDDTITNDIYTKAYQNAKQQNSDVVLFNVLQTDEVGKKWIEEENILPSFVNKNGKYLLEEVLFSFSRPWIWHTNWNKIIKRDFIINALSNIKLQKHLIMGEDLLYSVLLYSYGYKKNTFSSIDEIGLLYLKHQDAVTYKKTQKQYKKNFRDTLFVLKNIQHILFDYNLYHLYKKKFLQLQCTILQTYHQKIEFNIYLFFICFLKNLPCKNLFSLKIQAQNIAKKCNHSLYKEVAIFGTGEFALKIKNELAQKGIETLYFIKSNPNEDEKKLDNIPIKKLSSLRNQPKIPICIASIGSAYSLEKK